MANRKITTNKGTDQVVRCEHDEYTSSKVVSDVTDVVPHERSTNILDVNENIIRTDYYRGRIAGDVNVACLAASGLNSLHWVINGAYDKILFYIWYNVAAAGIDPAIAGKVGVEVSLLGTEDSNSVARITQAAMKANIFLEAMYNYSTTENIIDIQGMIKGTNTASADVDTGFTITNPSIGSEQLVQQSYYSYDAQNNLFSSWKNSYEQA